MSYVDKGTLSQVIRRVRDRDVILDFDMARLYEVETRNLVQAVKRNRARFPEDFMFRLTQEEVENLRSQIVISSWGGRRHLPYAFTEQGVAMLSGVLRSERADSSAPSDSRSRRRRMKKSESILVDGLPGVVLTCTTSQRVDEQRYHQSSRPTPFFSGCTREQEKRPHDYLVGAPFVWGPIRVPVGEPTLPGSS
jgi:hypothetical protein